MKIEDIYYIANQIKDESTRKAVIKIVEALLEEIDTKADA